MHFLTGFLFDSHGSLNNHAIQLFAWLRICVSVRSKLAIVKIPVKPENIYVSGLLISSASSFKRIGGMPPGPGDLSFFRDFKILFTAATSVRLCGTTSGRELSRVNTVSKWLA